MASRVTPEKVGKQSVIVVRVDDIQDYAFRDAQFCILKVSADQHVPLSLSVIPGFFSLDQELIDAVKAAVQNGSEVTDHGWLHENLTTFSLEEQEQRLTLAKNALNNVLGVKTTILVPPDFEFNNDTLLAMKKTGYDTISSSTDFQNAGVGRDGIVNLPSTVNFSDLINDTWYNKPLGQLDSEVNQSVSMYGYAMVVIHPQELLSGDKLNQTAVKTFEDLLTDLSGKYSFTTIKDLSNTIKKSVG
ncbi:MAG: DUF2334 domain-containing protein [Candidatus Bathyarchaeia archaeon]